VKLLLLSLSFAMLLATGSSTADADQSFRVVPIPKRETGYSNFASVAFTSKKEFDSFISKTSTQIGWNNRREFEDALRMANVDFTH